MDTKKKKDRPINKTQTAEMSFLRAVKGCTRNDRLCNEVH